MSILSTSSPVCTSHSRRAWPQEATSFPSGEKTTDRGFSSTSNGGRTDSPVIESRKPSERREDLAAGWEGSVWKTTMRLLLGLWEMREVYHQPSGVASMSVRISLSLVSLSNLMLQRWHKTRGVDWEILFFYSAKPWYVSIIKLIVKKKNVPCSQLRLSACSIHNPLHYKYLSHLFIILHFNIPQSLLVSKNTLKPPFLK